VITGSLPPHANVTRRRCCPTAKVLVAGGELARIASAELYDPAGGIWTSTDSLATSRDFHTMTLLCQRQGCLSQPGMATAALLSSAELYDVGLGFSNAWQPRISAITSWKPPPSHRFALPRPLPGFPAEALRIHRLTINHAVAQHQTTARLLFCLPIERQLVGYKL
jgi:hypothetical protein